MDFCKVKDLVQGYARAGGSELRAQLNECRPSVRIAPVCISLSQLVCTVESIGLSSDGFFGAICCMRQCRLRLEEVLDACAHAAKIDIEHTFNELVSLQQKIATGRCVEEGKLTWVTLVGAKLLFHTR